MRLSVQMIKRRPPSPADRLTDLNRHYRASLFAYFMRRCRNATEAEDLVQEVFARILAAPDIEDDRADGYIFTTAANLLRDRSRRDAVRSSYLEELVADRFAGIEHRDPERVLASRDALSRTKETLDKLPERTRVIFSLYRLEGMPRKEIADAFSISVSAVEKHISNAMKALMRLGDRP